MTKGELVEIVAERFEGRLTKKEIGELIEVVFATISSSLRETNRFFYRGFGTLSVRKRQARQCRDPRTGELMTVKASKTIGFRPAKELREKLE